MSTLSRYLRCTGAKIAFISETRCGLKKAELRTKKLSLCNSCLVPSRGKSGGLWLIWDRDVKLKVLQQSPNLIAAQITEQAQNSDWFLIAVYGDPKRKDNPAIWSEIESFLSQDASVLVIGDFNAIISATEKWGGQESLSSPNKAFRSWVNQSGLIDLGHIGPAYTWSNYQQGHANISERLDRGLASLPWTLHNPAAAVFHLPRFNSDHLPILIRPKQPPKKHKPTFRVENWWASREGFKEVCVAAAQQGGSDWSKVRDSFQQLVHDWGGNSKNPDTMLKEVEAQMLQLLSQNPDLISREVEKNLQEEHERCLRMHEQYWFQRSRVNFATMGDRNSKFYHASAVTRGRRNLIGSLLQPNGEWLTKECDIKRAFISHFKAIFSAGPRLTVQACYPPQLLLSLPRVQEHTASILDSIPSAHEIFAAVMTLGPNKAPGSDGINAKLIQENWSEFGPAVISEVLLFFQTGAMKPEIARTNMVLIPKSLEANTVGSFRPISICNFIYKVISKVLAIRLKPLMRMCVSRSQCAFLPGRDITENIILLREILHSFKQKHYKRPEFCLKVDLSKAFDRMNWDFLTEMLTLYGFPTRFTGWVMSCVKSAQFSLVFNGRSDGFFKPTCGLRQGCALSPYLFILGMDLLSRHLRHLLSANLLTGIKPAPSAAPLTDCLYADDLLIFGAATETEALRIRDALCSFASVSSQQVGPDKSTIWFSVATPQTEIAHLSNLLGVPINNESPRYLGAPIADGRSSHDFLIESFSARLSAWKGHTLSPAGRLVLIKSTLQSIPVFYMSTSKIPTKVIKSLTAIMRGFFWGKGDKVRYLSYVAWDKICRPIEEGGLGVKDLTAFNEALLLKNLWKVASGEEALWVDLVRSKYLPRSVLWQSKRTYNCTSFWRALMNLRDKLLPHVRVKLGDGSQCNAFGQPWANGTALLPPVNARQRKLKVKDLLQETGPHWDIQSLTDIFGTAMALQIVNEVPPPRLESQKDALIFTASADGDFSVSKIYILLRNSGQTGLQSTSPLWKMVWKKGNLQPRIRLFLWKVLHKALPLGASLAARGIRSDNVCYSCGADCEDAVHTFFLCPLARACWFSSPIPIRSHVLNEPIDITLQQFAGSLDDSQWDCFINTMWGIWRCRNDRIYGGVASGPEVCRKYLHAINTETMLAAAKGNPIAQPCHQSDYSNSDITCFVDGSWSSDWKGGIGFAIYQSGVLHSYMSASSFACCALQAEAQALKEAVKVVGDSGFSSCVFFTDNMHLAKTCAAVQPPIDSDWRAYSEILEVWQEFKRLPGYRCAHVSRSHNELADNLAKKGRTGGWTYKGFTFPTFL